MKKKIIKFYFFKPNYIEPSVNYLSFFSKRAIRQRHRVYKYINLPKKKKTSSTRDLVKQYKRDLYANIYYNQWDAHQHKLSTMFLSSQYLKTLNTRKDFIRCWFFFKNKYNRKNSKFMKKYPNTGVISSHFVHFLVRKNVVYQSRSKYVSSMFDMLYISYYMYFYSKLLYMYRWVQNTFLYSLSTNLTKKYLYINEDFNIVTTPWVTGKQNSEKYVMRYLSMHTQTNLSNYNSIDFTNNVYVKLQSHIGEIYSYTIEEDKGKKELIYNNLVSQLSDNELQFLPGVHMLFDLYFYTSSNAHYLNKFVKFII